MKVLLIILAIIVLIAILLALIAVIVKPASVYKNKPEEKNPLQGKRVRFVESSSEPVNADGVRGHLEATGDTEHKAGVYEIVFKRLFDIILSFFGLVILSPVYLFLTLWIVIDDPGPVLFTQKRLGRNKQYFKLHKFRSMKMSTPHDKPTHMLENPEQYITKAGKFIRAHSLDHHDIIRQTTETPVNKGLCGLVQFISDGGRDHYFLKTQMSGAA